MNASIDWLRRENYLASPSKAYLTESEAFPRLRALDRNVDPSATVPKPAEWIIPVVQRLSELLTMKEDWDSYGAAAPSLSAARSLIEVLGLVMTNETPHPFVVPCPDGHFQVEWHRNGVDLEVEVFGATKINVLYSGPEGEWNKVLSNDLTLLVEALGKIGNTKASIGAAR
jgi:hypothetical protein